jgi:small subunit ribosomal protein S15
MARMHSRAKGQHGSTRPAKLTKPSWLSLKPKEIEMLVVKYAKEGKGLSKIGLYLRDEYGVPSVKVVTGKSVKKILNEKKLLPEIPEDLMSLMRKSVLIRKHMAANKKDMTSKRGLQLTESKINRLAKHYKATKVIPAEWKYDPEQIRLYVE